MNKKNLHTIFSNSNCLSEEKLIAYCNNELTNLERNEVERHTINCKFCSYALEGFSNNIQNKKDYYSTKAQIFKKEKNNKPYIISIIGIAAACLAFVLLFNDFNGTQTEIAKNEARQSQKRKSKSYQKKQDSINEDALTNLKEAENSDMDPALKVTNETNSDATTNLNVSSEDFSSELYSEPRDYKSQNKLLEEIEETKFEDEKVSLSEIKDEDKIIYNWDNEITNKTNQTQNRKSKSKEFKKINESNNSLNKSLFASDKHTENKDIPLKQDTSAYRLKNSSTDVVSKKRNSILEADKASEIENKSDVKSSYSDGRNIALMDSVDASKQILDSLKEKSEFDSGLTEYNKQAYNKAIHIFLKIKKENKYYFKAQLFIGKAYVKIGKNQKAKLFFKNALKGNKNTKNKASKALQDIK